MLDKIVEEVEEFRQAGTQQERVHELGDLMFALVNLARWTGVHAEDVLRQGNRRFQSRYLRMEALAVEKGLDFGSLPLMGKEGLWQEAKAEERGYPET